MLCREAFHLMHEYLDGDLQESQVLELKKHMVSCRSCRENFRQMQTAEALLRGSLPQVKAPDDLTARIMQSLPRPSRRSLWLKQMKRHPAVTVAAVFLAVMTASYISLWDQEKELVVKGTDLSQVVIEGNTVHVPAGRTVYGNLMVENGKIQVDGEVKGNVIVIDGTLALASTAHIAGKITTVDKAAEWVVYKIGELFGKLSE